MYNVPTATLAERAAQVWKTTPSSTFIRMFRFLAAYGIGGVGNKFLIAQGRAWSENKFYSESTVH
jgi:hypothetical protein